MVRCNQICPWNYYEIGCKKPNDELCPMSNLATKEKQHTNADRIRAMSDEELAENLCNNRLTKEMWLKWLKQPAEGDA